MRDIDVKLRRVGVGITVRDLAVRGIDVELRAVGVMIAVKIVVWGVNVKWRSVAVKVAVRTHENSSPRQGRVTVSCLRCPSHVSGDHGPSPWASM